MKSTKCFSPLLTAGVSKRGGVRLIYFNVLEDGLIVMSYFYAKNEQENISPSELQKLKG